MRTITRQLVLVLFTSAVLCGVASAQRGEEQTAPTRAEREQAAKQKEHAEGRGQEHAGAAESKRGEAANRGEAAQRDAAKRGEAAHRDAAARIPAAEQRALAAEIAHQETTHRGRMAKLKRLKDLAQKAHQADRVKAVDELQHKELQNHKRKMAMLSAKLAPDGKAAVERAVERGREVQAHTPAERRAALQKWKKEHPGRSHGVETRGDAAKKRGG